MGRAPGHLDGPELEQAYARHGITFINYEAKCTCGWTLAYRTPIKMVSKADKCPECFRPLVLLPTP